MKSNKKMVTAIDVFGQEINLTFMGRDKYKTMIGTFFTVLCGVLLLTIGTFTLLRVFSGEIQRIDSEEIWKILDQPNGFNPILLDQDDRTPGSFAFAFGFGTDLDPAIGELSLQSVR